MYITYIIQNDNSRKFYIGSPNDITRRLEEHNRGQTRSTRQKGKWNLVYLVYQEEFNTSSEAKRRERIIKSYKVGNAFKKLLAGLVHR